MRETARGRTSPISLQRSVAMLGALALVLLLIGSSGVLAAARGGSWAHHRDLLAPPETLPLGLGSCVSASADGLLAVGCGMDRDVGGDAGSVTLWQPSADGASPLAVITHPKGSQSAGFLAAVALDPRGSLLCVGAPHETGDLGWPDGFQTGRVYLYALDRRGPRLEWQLAATLRSPAEGQFGSAGGHFGASVATDGFHVVVGSPDDSGQSFAAGRCDVFVQDGVGWKHTAHFPSPTGERTGRFGRAVAMDADVIVVGWSQAEGSFPNQGRADLFCLSTRPNRLDWRHCAVLNSPSPTNGGMFGASVAIDGDLIAVGAPREWSDRGETERTGRVHLWRVNRTDAFRVRLSESLAPPPSPCHSLGMFRPEAFGMSLALRGPLLAVGATEACGVDSSTPEPSGREGSGCVHVLERSGESWTATARLQSPMPEDEVHDGWGVAIGPRRQPWIAASRLGDLEQAPGPGRVLIFSTPSRAAATFNAVTAVSR